MNLDLVAAAMCGWVAVCCFALQAFGHPRHERWMVIPAYVRWGMIATGAMFAVRSVNLWTLPPIETSAAGHVNREGVLALVALTYLLTALAVWSGIFKRLPAKAWFRLEWAEREARKGKVPLMVEPEEVQEIARLQRYNVNGRDPSEPAAGRPPEQLH